MRKRLRSLLFLLAILCCLLGIAGMVWGYNLYRTAVVVIPEGEQGLAEARPDTVTMLPPGVTFERCVPLTPGDTLSYAFKADQPVVFDVHYHRGARRYYAWQKRAVTSEAGTYQTTVSREYCLTWRHTNREAIRLSWRYKAQSASQVGN